MNKKTRTIQIISAIFVILLGTFFHFTFKLSGENKIVAIFSSINESVWEHLKLIFFPMLISTIIGYFLIGKNTSNYICSKTIGIIISMVFVIVFFYTYTGIIGKNIAIVDISSFIIAVLLGEYISYLLIVNRASFKSKICIIILIIISLSFSIFTFYTPKIGLFKDPITNIYGLNKIKIL